MPRESLLNIWNAIRPAPIAGNSVTLRYKRRCLVVRLGTGCRHQRTPGRTCRMETRHARKTAESAHDSRLV